MDIKVGEFVINQNRLVIGQIIAIDKEEQEAILKIEEGEIPIGFWNIKKHSFNLIDLIEVGDLLEIELSEEFVEKEDKNVFTRLGDVYTKETLQRDVDNGIVINIKTILTHEQYK